ncbi:multidrug effflux MFS transporter [Azospirillum halopraeferens]|uniref:multidrug effflux MFS transporter n=1 Tax=Azospirillum halopraeferens TaxID=34010 RepID=UPI0004178F46|nr:multidrug effflux MFS transporter [Azospirillum halopraeferens]
MTASPSKPPVWLLIAATATGPLALNIFVPSMPGLPAAFDTVPATVQLTLSLFLIGVAFGQLVYGPLSDRFGRRPTLLFGFGLYTVASLACALAPSIGLLVVGRVAQALGGCAGMVIARAIVRDAWGREEATGVLALVIAGMAVAPMVAPAIGGFLDVWLGWRSGFLLLVAFGGAVWLAAVRLLPETHRTPTPMPGPSALWAAYRSLLVRPAFLGYALTTAAVTAVFFCFLAGAPFVMVERLGRPPSEYGLFFILLSAGYMAGNLAVSRLSGRLDGDTLVRTGMACTLLGPLMLLAFLLAGVLSPAVLFLPSVLLCFGNGLTLPPAMTAAIGVEPRLAGTASGLLGFLQMGAGAVASTLIGAIGPGEPLVMTLGMVACAGLAVAAFALARRGSDVAEQRAAEAQAD